MNKIVPQYISSDNDECITGGKYDRKICPRCPYFYPHYPNWKRHSYRKIGLTREKEIIKQLLEIKNEFKLEMTVLWHGKEIKSEVDIRKVSPRIVHDNGLDIKVITKTIHGRKISIGLEVSNLNINSYIDRKRVKRWVKNLEKCDLKLIISSFPENFRLVTNYLELFDCIYLQYQELPQSYYRFFKNHPCPARREKYKYSAPTSDTTRKVLKASLVVYLACKNIISSDFGIDKYIKTVKTHDVRIKV